MGNTSREMMVAIVGRDIIQETLDVVMRNMTQALITFFLAAFVAWIVFYLVNNHGLPAVLLILRMAWALLVCVSRMVARCAFFVVALTSAVFVATHFAMMIYMRVETLTVTLHDWANVFM